MYRAAKRFDAASELLPVQGCIPTPRDPACEIPHGCIDRRVYLGFEGEDEKQHDLHADAPGVSGGRGPKNKQQAATQMVSVSVEVRSGVARFLVAVVAESIEGALEMVRRLNPTKELKVIFPIEAEGFFVEDSPARVGTDEKVAA
jgi:hypothetical protein